MEILKGNWTKKNTKMVNHLRWEEDITERRRRVFKLHEWDVEELKCRMISTLSFMVIVVLFGMPLWWHTTSTYRVPFRNFPEEQRIVMQISIVVACGSRPLDLEVEKASSHLMDALQNLSKIERLDFIFDLKLLKVSSDEHPVANSSDRRFKAHLMVVDKSDWKYGGEAMHFGFQEWAYIKYTDDGEELLRRMLTAVTDVFIDMGHLSTIIRRDLKQRLTSAETAALSPNQQKRLVWDSAALSANYIVQVIFAHAGGDYSSDWYDANEVLLNVRRFAERIAEVTELRVTGEHLWDFDLSSFRTKDAMAQLKIGADDISNIVTKVDQETSTVESSAPLLKLVVLDHREEILLLDQARKIDTGGVVVASWGAVVSSRHGNAEAVSQSMIGALRVLLGLDTELPYGATRHPSPVSEWELNRLKLRSFVDCSMNAITSVQAIHKLIAQIDSIVINDEVADTADSAVEYITRALEEAETTGDMEVAWAVEGRVLAEKAVNHQSLLSLLYFPTEQKFAIYMPLFLPISLPMIGSVFRMVRFFKGNPGQD